MRKTGLGAAGMILLLWMGAAHAAPEGVLQGVLLERGNRAPLAGVMVEIPALGIDVVTDADGTFAVASLAPGTQTVRIEDEAYERLEDTVTIRAGEVTHVVWHLTPTGFASDDLRVVGRRSRKEVTRRVITADEIKTVPGTNGDPLLAVQSLPGAARLPFGQGDVILRGGGNSRAALNGQWIPNAFHFGGIRSVVSGSLIGGLDIVPGNYGVDYGRGNGGLVTVNTRRPRADRFGGMARVDLFDAELMLEGPLTENSTVAVAGRRSYIDAVLPAVLGDDSPFKTAPRYFDFQGVHDYRAGAHQVSTVVFGSHDALVLLFDDPPEADPAVRGSLLNEEGFLGVQSTWKMRLGDDTTHQLLLGYLRYTGLTQLGDALDIDVKLDVLTVRDQIEQRFNDVFTARGGVDLEVIWGDFDVTAPNPPREGAVDQPLSAQPSRKTVAEPLYAQPAVWAEGTITLGDVLLVPGIRIDYSSALDDFAVQPRLTARAQLAKRTAIKAAAGLYAEHTDPEQTDPVFGNPDLDYERGQQYSVGVEHGLTDALGLDVTLFYKGLDGLARPVDDPSVKYLGQGEGRAYGAEVLLRQASGGRFHGWLAYTWMRAERKDGPGNDWRIYDFDQTHILNIVGQFRITRTWEIGGRFRYVTGNPTTPYRGATYDSDGDVFVPIAGRLNSARLPAFHQLDLRMDKRWLFDDWTLTTYLDVQNVYANQNAEGISYNFDYTRSTQAAGLPILPTLGLQGDF